MRLELVPGWEIPERELSFRAVCSSGPGGQNVNKVSTKVQLRYAVQESSTLSLGQKLRLQACYPSHFTQAGEFLVICDETRSLETNKERSLSRLRSMILNVRFPPKLRHKTRPTRGSKERRLSDKKSRSALKVSRRGPSD